MTKEGYIKLYRSIQHQPWYHDSEAVHLFVHLLINAAFAPYQTMTGMKVHTVEPGQLVTGRKRLAAETAINESKIQRLLKVFEDCNQIEQQTNNINRCISVVNWHVFQESEQQTNNRRTTNEQQTNNERTLNKNIKNIKEDKEGKGVPPQGKDFDLLKRIGKDAARMWTEGNLSETLNGKSELALEWLEHLAQMGKPYRSHAQIASLVKNFKKFTPERLRAMMDYSIPAGYPNLYPLRS